MAQHVTFWRMKVLPGKLDELKRNMEREEDEARLKSSGWQATIIGTRKDNPDEVWGVVTWDNSDNYRKNAESPDQNEWYQKTRALLSADPEWFDCDVMRERRA